MTTPWDLSDYLNEAGKPLSDGAKAEMLSQARDLLHANMALSTLAPGDQLPAFTLQNATGMAFDSQKMLASGPMVIVFYRGSWCPYCNMHLGQIQAELDTIQASGGQLVAISPEMPDRSLTLTEKLQLEFEILSDTDNTVARAFGLVFEVPVLFRAALKELSIDFDEVYGKDVVELPVPASFVVDRAGRIVFSQMHPDYTQRTNVAQMITALQSLSEEVSS